MSLTSVQISECACVPACWRMVAFTCVWHSITQSLPRASSMTAHKLHDHFLLPWQQCSAAFQLSQPPPTPQILFHNHCFTPRRLCGIPERIGNPQQHTTSGSSSDQPHYSSPLVSPNLSSWSKVIIIRQELVTGSRRHHSEIYSPIGAIVWPRSWQNSTAFCFCERRFNLIKSRLMAYRLALPELQQKLSEEKAPHTSIPLQDLPLSCSR